MRAMTAARCSRMAVKPCVSRKRARPASIRIMAGSGRKPSRDGLLGVLDIGEHNARRALGSIIEIELTACEKHGVAIEIFADGRLLVLGEFVELLFVVRRDPAGKLEFARIEADFEAVFGFETNFQHVELERTDDADER